MPHKNMGWDGHDNPLTSTPTHLDRPIPQNALSPAINETVTRADRSGNSKVSIIPWCFSKRLSTSMQRPVSGSHFVFQKQTILRRKPRWAQFLISSSRSHGPSYRIKSGGSGGWSFCQELYVHVRVRMRVCMCTCASQGMKENNLEFRSSCHGIVSSSWIPSTSMITLVLTSRVAFNPWWTLTAWNELVRNEMHWKCKIHPGSQRGGKNADVFKFLIGCMGNVTMLDILL